MLCLSLNLSLSLQQSPSRSRMRAIIHREQVVGGKMGIFLRRRERRMAQKFLNRPQIRSFVEQMRGEGVTERVRADFSPGQPARVPVHDAVHAADGQSSAAQVAEHGIGSQRSRFEVRSSSLRIVRIDLFNFELRTSNFEPAS